MRHGVAGRKLNRSSSHRKAMLNNMVASLFEHERIHTTVPKAKEARRIAEHVITLGKRGGLHNVRLAERTVRSRDLLQKIFGELKDRYSTRPGGYTRIIRTGFRQGDAAEMAFLELVDRAGRPEEGGEEKPQEKTEKKPEKKAAAETAPEEKPAKKPRKKAAKAAEAKEAASEKTEEKAEKKKEKKTQRTARTKKARSEKKK